MSTLLALVAVLLIQPAVTVPSATTSLEIRSYRLKSGQRDRFHQLFERESLPLLRRHGVDVVAYGPSLHDADSFFLIRAFPSLEARERAEEAFYGSAAWRDGPRAFVLAAIEAYTTVVIHVDSTTLAGARRIMSTPEHAHDLAALTRLNQDYIDAVATSDVQRFREILAPDFLCTLPDGRLIDREQFLAQTAEPYTLRDLRAEDVHIRLLGDVAIVHARTTFALASGMPGSGQYTDVWSRRDGRWVAVAAHVTRK
jgi:uncharacterized protein (TIGR02246 family)